MGWFVEERDICAGFSNGTAVAGIGAISDMSARERKKIGKYISSVVDGGRKPG